MPIPKNVNVNPAVKSKYSGTIDKAIQLSQQQLAGGSKDGTGGSAYIASNQVENAFNDKPLSQEQYVDKQDGLGLPPNWSATWRDQKLGPDGQQLPKGATGWDRYGKADYGGGWSGYWKQVGARLRGEENSFGFAQDLLAKEKKGSAITTGLTIDADLGERTDVLKDQVQGAWVQKAAKNASNYISTGIDVVLDGINSMAKGTKQVLGTAELTREQLAEYQYIKDPRDLEKLDSISDVQSPEDLLRVSLLEDARTQSELAGLTKKEKRGNFVELLDGMIGMFTSPLEAVAYYNPFNYNSEFYTTGFKEIYSKDNLQKNWEASRIIYSMFGNETVKQDFMRRYDDPGEDPRLLAMELENPIHEMVGEMILDPLNWVGLGTIKELAQAAKIKKAIGISDDLLGAMGIAADAKKANAFSELGKANELIKAKRTINTGAGAEEALQNTLKVLKQKTSDMGTALDKMKYQFGLNKMTTAGKIDHFKNKHALLTRMMAQSTGGADDFIDSIKALIKVNSGDDSKIAEGFSYLVNTKNPNLFLSDEALEYGNFMSRYYDEAKLMDDFGKNLGDIDKAGDIGKFINAVDNINMRVINSSTPTFLDTAKAVGDIKKKISLGETVTEAESKMLKIAQYDEVGITLAKFDKFANATYKGFINKIFSAVYLGMSPAYAVRNALDGITHAFVDIGISGAFDVARGDLSVIFNKGRFVDELATRTSKIMGGGPTHVLPPQTMKEIGGFANSVEGVSGTKNIFMKMIDVANKFEQAAGVAIEYHTVRRVMNKMLKPGVIMPDVGDLIRMGLPQETADLLVSISKRNMGDFDDTLETIKKFNTAGSYRWVEANDIFDGKFGNFVTQMGFEDKVRAASQNPNKKQAMAELDALLEDILNEADRAKRELPHLSPDEIADAGPEGQASVSFVRAVKDGFLKFSDRVRKNAQIKLNTRHAKEFQAAFVRAHTVLSTSTANLPQGAKAAIDDVFIKTNESVTEIIDRYTDINTSTLSQDELFRSKIAGEFNIKKLDDLWDELGTPLERPVTGDSEAYRKALYSVSWNKTRGAQESLYAARRDEMTKAYTEAIAQFKQINPVDEIDSLFKTAWETDDLSRKYDTAVLFDDGFYALNDFAKENWDMVEQLAKANGVPTATPNGTPTNTLMRIIKKHLGPEYGARSIANTPFDDVKEALIRYKKAHNEQFVNVLPRTEFDDLMTNIGKSTKVIDEAAPIAKAPSREFKNLWEFPKDSQEYKALESMVNEQARKRFGKQIKKGLWDNTSKEDMLRAEKEIADKLMQDVIGGKEKRFVNVTINPLVDDVFGKYTEKAAEVVPEAAKAVTQATPPAKKLPPFEYPEGSDEEKMFQDIIFSEVQDRFDKRYGQLADEAPAKEMAPWEYPKGSPEEKIYNEMVDAEAKKITGLRSYDSPSAEKLEYKSTRAGMVQRLKGNANKGFQSKIEKAIKAAQPEKVVDEIPENAFDDIYDEVVASLKAGNEPDIAKKIADDIPEIDDVPAILDDVEYPTGLEDLDVNLPKEDLPGLEHLESMNDSTMTVSKAMFDQQNDITAGFKKMKQTLNKNWDKREAMSFVPELQKEIDKWVETAKINMVEARGITMKIADEARNFALHNYNNQYGIDLALSHIYPYNFWYTRTYKNWIQRVGTAPGAVAAYAKYRRALEKIHAGMPSYWKYQLNTNELLGLDSENPLYINLEASLNPLNALTGVDFNDPKRMPEGKLNLVTSTLDALNKFGPSTWTPYNLILAVMLKEQGEEEAAARWGGRILPQTALIKAVTSLIGMDPVEWDLGVKYFSNGTDPYERTRIGYALGTLYEQRKYSLAQLEEAKMLESGPIWDEARTLAIRARAPGQIASSLLGVGYKPRTKADIEVSLMYNQYYKLMSIRDELSPQEFTQAMSEMHEEFPTMNTILMSKLGGTERDISYSYSVLSRIPPSDALKYLEAAGIKNKKIVDKFYETKGFEGWAEEDKTSFMNAIVILGAMIEVPDNATRQEWTSYKIKAQDVKDSLVGKFGEGIIEKMDYYMDKTYDERRIYSLENPEIEQAFQYKDSRYAANDLLSAYGMPYESVKRYYNGAFRNEALETFGPNIFIVIDDYYNAMDWGDAKEYKKEHPEVKKYLDLQKKYSAQTDDAINALAMQIQDIKPATMRSDIRINETTSVGKQDVYAESQKPQSMLIPMEVWTKVFDGDLLRNIASGNTLSELDSELLSFYAESMGTTAENVKSMIIESASAIE